LGFIAGFRPGFATLVQFPGRFSPSRNSTPPMPVCGPEFFRDD
jgi:allophanate hydrolase subunit 1